MGGKLVNPFGTPAVASSVALTMEIHLENDENNEILYFVVVSQFIWMNDLFQVMPPTSSSEQAIAFCWWTGGTIPRCGVLVNNSKGILFRNYCAGRRFGTLRGTSGVPIVVLDMPIPCCCCWCCCCDCCTAGSNGRAARKESPKTNPTPTPIPKIASAAFIVVSNK